MIMGVNMDKATLIAKRTEFFKAILEQLRRTPARIDQILQQSGFYMPIDEDNTFFDADTGDFAICVKGDFHGKQFDVYYSLWQLGDMLRIGVAIYDEELQGAFASDTHNEVFYIWGMKNDPRVDVAHGCVFYDWEFEVKDLYDSYKNQERFILGARHMHFRVMRILNDECQRIYFSKNRDTFNNDYPDQGMDTIEDFEKFMK
jgi:hypothetical protein